MTQLFDHAGCPMMPKALVVSTYARHHRKSLKRKAMSWLPTVSLTLIEPTPPANPAATMVFRALAIPPL